MPLSPMMTASTVRRGKAALSSGRQTIYGAAQAPFMVIDVKSGDGVAQICYQLGLLQWSRTLAPPEDQRLPRCVSAWNKGSDSHLMILHGGVALVCEENQRHGEQLAPVFLDPCRIDRRRYDRERG